MTTRTQAAVRGLIGTIGIAVIVFLSLNYNKLPLVGNSDVIHADFAEAGGLTDGDVVMISGAEVGKVRAVRLEGNKVVADLVLTGGAPRLGASTKARIITITLLGRAAVELVPGGTGSLKAGDTIPRDRTMSPYNITSALNDLTSTTQSIDKTQLADALRQSTLTLQGTQGDVGPALRGITAVSSAVANNDEQLGTLLARASRVTQVLASRNDKIDTLLGSGGSLLKELDARQKVVVRLLVSVQELSAQLKGVVGENEATIGPALDQLNQIVNVLNANKASLQGALTGLNGYATAFGEAVSTGPWFDAYIQNLTAPSSLVPILSGVGQ
ncbi:MAG: hypothetical protein NVS3B21_10080 [Acidimicrobiales bacterium]